MSKMSALDASIKDHIDHSVNSVLKDVLEENGKLVIELNKMKLAQHDADAKNNQQYSEHLDQTRANNKWQREFQEKHGKQVEMYLKNMNTIMMELGFGQPNKKR